MLDTIKNLFGIKLSGVFKKKDDSTPEERSIRSDIKKILNKKGTKVSMAPLSRKFIITNASIDLTILIDGHKETIKTTGSKKYVWKFRGEFIDEMIDLSVVWIEKDRAETEKRIFQDELEILNDIETLIDGIPDNE